MKWPNTISSKGMTKPRQIEFIGQYTNNSVVIGNYGDARLVARGSFNLSGIIYCRKSTVEIWVQGEGKISFTGCCNKLLIKGIAGNCTIDLSNVSSQAIWCESVKGNAVITLGPTKVIELISLDNDAIVRYEGGSLILNYVLKGNSRIESWQKEN